MESNPKPSGNVPPPKPWEQSGAPSGSTPFKPSSAGSTTQVVETSGTSRPGEIVSTSDSTTTINRKPVGRPLPTRPWEQTYGSSCHYGGYGSALNYNSGFNSRLYGSYGGLGGVYGNNMYRGGFGGVYRSGMYGGGVYGVQDPNSPFGASPSPPGFWISVVRVVQGVVNFVGRLSRFVLRLPGIRTRRGNVVPAGSNGLLLPGPNKFDANQKLIEGPKGSATVSWDQFWEDGTSK